MSKEKCTKKAAVFLAAFPFASFILLIYRFSARLVRARGKEDRNLRIVGEAVQSVVIGLFSAKATRIDSWIAFFAILEAVVLPP